MAGKKLTKGEIAFITKLADQWVSAKGKEAERLLLELGQHAIDLLEHIEASQEEEAEVAAVAATLRDNTFLYVIRRTGVVGKTHMQPDGSWGPKASAQTMQLTHAESRAKALRARGFSVVIVRDHGGPNARVV